MKKPIVKFSAICFIITFLIVSYLPQKKAYAIESGDYIYTVTDGKATIHEYTGSETEISIPATIDGYPVTSIGEGAFAWSYLVSIIIPDSVTHIGERAFFYCVDLSDLTIPINVISIGSDAFEGCVSLPKIDVNPENENYSSVDGVLYNKLKTSLICYPGGKPGSEFSVPSSVTSISSSAFENVILSSIIIPNSVTSIDENAFFDCYYLENIEVDNTNTKYSSADGVLYNKEKTSLIFYPAGKPSSSFTVPSGVTSIEVQAFDNYEVNTTLTSVTLPKSIVSIARFAFYGCSSLTLVNFLGNAPEVGEYTFPGYSSEFKVYYVPGATGFTNPWNGYRTEPFQQETYTIPYDVNKDGEVSISDLALVAQSFNSRDKDAKWNLDFDFNKDGIVDIFDLVACSKKLI